MIRYALLTRESSNRVFGTVAPQLLRAEVEAISPHLSGGVKGAQVETLGGLPFISFETEALTTTDIFILSNLALGRGLFEHSDTGGLQPIDVTPLEWFGSDLITIQRYVGKTNEQFTHLLVNLGVAASAAAHQRAKMGERVRLLDPVSGRGSTLNRGLVYGFDVAGVEVDGNSVDQHRVFLTTYLKDKRIKHKTETERFRKGELAGASGFRVAIRPMSPESEQRVQVFRAETSQSPQLFSGKRFDVIAGDLPYGVQHSSKKTSAKGSASNRSPEQLVTDSIARWAKLLAKNGAIALSWNVLTMERATLAGLLTNSGLDVVEHPESFEHVVDRQITRDVIVARSAPR